MPKQQVHTATVREWLTSLGVLVAVSLSREEATMKLAAYVPQLMNDFTDAAFNQASLNHVAKACAKGFPTYPELHASLREWCRDHAPQQPRLTVDGSDIAAVERARQKRLRESWDNPQAIEQSVRNCAGDRLLLKTLASAVRQYAPQHRDLVPIDDEAIDVPAPTREERQPPRASYLTPEQLQLAKAQANGASDAVS